MAKFTTAFLTVASVCLLELIAYAVTNVALRDDVEEQIHVAHSLHEKGKVDDAWKAYDSLRRTLEKRPRSAQLGFVLNEMSKIASGRGDYDEALMLAAQSASVYHEIGDTKGESHSVNIKGLAEVDQGNYRSAEQSFTTALSLSRAAQDTENEVQVLNNIGSAYYFEGKYLEAMHSYENAKQILDRIASEKWKSYWRQVTDFNQATLYQRIGRYETALQIYKQVEASSTAITLGDRAHVKANLGTLYRRLGDPWKALEAYREAQSLFAKDRDADGELGVLKNIGILYALELKDLHKAQGIFTRVLRLSSGTKNRREEMQAHLYLGETNLLKKAVGVAQSEFEHARRMSEELGTPEEHWKALYGLGQCEASLGNYGASERYHRQSIGIIEKSRVQLQLSALRAEFLGDKRNVYDALIALLLRRNAVDDAFLYMERSRARNFQDRFTSERAGGAEPLTLPEVRSRLAPGSAVIEYWTAGDQVAAIWCSRDQTRVLLLQVPAAQQKRILELIESLPDAADDWRSHLAGLAPLLPVDWLEAEPEVRHLLMIPDNWLSLVPFDLLPTRPNAEQLLIERANIAYLPSAVLLRRERPFHPLRPPWFRQLVAFGEPVIRTDAQFRTIGFGGDNLLSLPFSGKEVREIAALIPGKAVLLLGNENRKSTFLGGMANSAPLLHLSTHAFADASNPEDSRLLFSSEGVSESGSDFLFLRELYGVDLSNVALAVLSACDTERGKVVRGEGVQAFSRALLAAGSQSSVTTLWRVDDRATAEFMKQFYYFLVERRMARGEALRQAKVKFLHSHSAADNPKYWAAFIISGEALTPVPEVLGWRTLVLVVLIAVALTLFTVLWLGSRRRTNWKHNA